MTRGLGRRRGVGGRTEAAVVVVVVSGRRSGDHVVAVVLRPLWRDCRMPFVASAAVAGGNGNKAATDFSAAPIRIAWLGNIASHALPGSRPCRRSSSRSS
jgi:hypothetical protein